jgi:hypothetical protein
MTGYYFFAPKAIVWTYVPNQNRPWWPAQFSHYDIEKEVYVWEYIFDQQVRQGYGTADQIIPFCINPPKVSKTKEWKQKMMDQYHYALNNVFSVTKNSDTSYLGLKLQVGDHIGTYGSIRIEEIYSPTKAYELGRPFKVNCSDACSFTPTSTVIKKLKWANIASQLQYFMLIPSCLDKVQVT